jgi:IclR family pca regulon transcriptional regulator
LTDFRIAEYDPLIGSLAMAEDVSTVEDNREFIQGLAKGLAVIEAFGRDTPSQTLSEVARRTRISPGSARRVLLTLERLGYVASDGQRFALQPRALQLGYAYLASLPLTGLAQPLLSQLTRDIDDSCSLGLLDGEEVVFVARASARRLVRDYMTVGMRYPAHATSVGKLLLAVLPEPEQRQRLERLKLQALTSQTITDSDVLRRELAQISERGWALNDQETIVGLRSIAVPVRVDGTVMAALTASSAVTRTNVAELQTQFLPRLLDAARVLESLMTAREPAGAIQTDSPSQ